MAMETNQHDAAIQASNSIAPLSSSDGIDNSDKIGRIPTVLRKLKHDDAAERSKVTKPSLIDDVKDF